MVLNIIKTQTLGLAQKNNYIYKNYQLNLTIKIYIINDNYKDTLLFKMYNQHIRLCMRATCFKKRTAVDEGCGDIPKYLNLFYNRTSSTRTNAAGLCWSWRRIQTF